MGAGIVIAPIVEGIGEVNGIRPLITRIASDIVGGWVEVAQPFRLDSGKMRRPDEIARAIRFQAIRVTGAGGVLIVRDGDDKDVRCPVELAGLIAPDPGLVSVPVEIVIAYHEYETWFLAAVDSLRVHPSVRDDAIVPADVEKRRGAKQQLQGLMTESYKETLHQAKFSAVMDLHEARARSRSFRRMVSAVSSLVETAN